MMSAARTSPVARICRTCMNGMIQPIRRIDRLNAEVCSHWTYSIMVIFSFLSHVPEFSIRTMPAADVRRGFPPSHTGCVSAFRTFMARVRSRHLSTYVLREISAPNFRHMNLPNANRGIGGSQKGDIMSMIKQTSAAAFILGSFVFAGGAAAQGVDVKIGVGIPLSPGQQGTSPGQTFNAARALDPTAP